MNIFAVCAMTNVNTDGKLYKGGPQYNVIVVLLVTYR